MLISPILRTESRFRGLMILCLVAMVVAFASSGAVAAQTAGTQIEPVELLDVRLVQSGSGADLRIEGNSSLVWTQYRDAASNLVIELPNTQLGSDLGDLRPSEGLVEAIEMISEANGTRPLTRIIVRTRAEAEHSLEVDDSVLSLSLVGVGMAAQQVDTQVTDDVAIAQERLERTGPNLDESLNEFEETPTALADAESEEDPAIASSEVASESIAEQASLEESTSDSSETVGTPAAEEATSSGEYATASLESPVASRHRLGTADDPARAPFPTGIVATRLEGLRVVAGEGDQSIHVLGDGEFDYSTFLLENPSRFVVDLQGVVNMAPESTVPVYGDHVDRVRMAQFRPQPAPVARVVLDLGSNGLPFIERTGDGLIVRFVSEGQPMPANAVASVAAPAPTPLDFDSPPSDAPSGELASDDDWSDETATDWQAGGVEVDAPLAEDSYASDDLDGAGGVTDEWDAQAPLQIAQAPPEAPVTGNVSLFEAQDVEIKNPPPLVQPTSNDSFGVQAIGGVEKEYFGEPISMSLKDADITEVLRSIARLSGLNIVIQPGVQGPVTVELDRVPWDQALEQILKINNLGMQLEGNILRIAPVAQLQAEARAAQELLLAKALSVPLKTVLKRISYARASEVARILTTGQRNTQGSGIGGAPLGNPGGILSQRGSVSVERSHEYADHSGASRLPRHGHSDHREHRHS